MSNMTRHQAWQKMYHENRYCRHLSQSELDRRIRDIVLNMLRLRPDGKLGLPPMEAEGGKAMELFTHVQVEMEIRHGPYPNGYTRDIFHLEPFPDLVGELGQKAASILKDKGLKSNDVFIKFGKIEHMQPLFERGALRVQSASYYATPNHNGAIRDDELTLPLSLALSREDIIKIVLNPQDVPDKPIEQRLDATYNAGTDYWLYCVTSAVEPRLFVDFQADACVIIKDKSRFQKLLTLQSAANFPDTGHIHGQAIYVDPLRPSTAKIDVPMSKHFRYEYQREYRFVWRPLKPMANLAHIDLEIGSLKDIAELVIV